MELSSVPSTTYQTVSFFLGIFLALLPLIRLNHLAWSRSVHGCFGKDHISCKEIHFCSVAQSCPTLCNPMTAACQASLSITNCRSLPKPITIELVMTANHLILCRPLLLPPSVVPSIRVFSNESVLPIRWPKYWSFSFSPSNENSGLISFGIDWFDLLARDSQESTPTPQFKSINSSALSFLCSPTLTSIHDYWKNHSFN